MGYLLLLVSHLDLVQVLNGKGKASMLTEDLSINGSRQAEVVTDLSTVAAYIHQAIFAQVLIIEALDLDNLVTLMIAPDQSDMVMVSNLKSQQETEGFNTAETTVHKISLRP